MGAGPIGAGIDRFAFADLASRKRQPGGRFLFFVQLSDGSGAAALFCYVIVVAALLADPVAYKVFGAGEIV